MKRNAGVQGIGESLDGWRYGGQLFALDGATALIGNTHARNMQCADWRALTKRGKVAFHPTDPTAGGGEGSKSGGLVPTRG
jgi:hypothetical protein